MKLNYKRTILVGFAFFLICAFWQAYDTIIPKLLTDRFGLSQTVSGIIMALDNVLALFMLPLFGSISDKTNTKYGKRTPYIVVGTIVAVCAFISLSVVDYTQLKMINSATKIDNVETLGNIYDSVGSNSVKTPDGVEFVINQKFDRDEFTSIKSKISETKFTADYIRFTTADGKDVNRDHQKYKTHIVTYDGTVFWVRTADAVGQVSLDSDVEINDTILVNSRSISLSEMFSSGASYENIGVPKFVEGTNSMYTNCVVPARQAYIHTLTSSSPANLIWFMAILLLVLISMSTFRSPAVALMPDVTLKFNRSKANAIINLMGTLGGMMILILGMGFAFNNSAIENTFRPYFAFFAVVGAIMLAALAVFVLTVKEKKWVEERELLEAELEKTNEPGADTVALAEIPEGGVKHTLSAGERCSLLFILASVALWYIGYNAVTSKYSVYATSVLDLDYSLTLLIANAAALISYIPVGIISSKIGRKKTILAGVAMLSVSFFVAAFLRVGSSPLLMNAMFALAGIGWATINVNSFPMVVELAKSGDTGKYTGYYYTASMAAQIITPIFSGFLMDRFGMGILFVYATVFVVLSGITMLLVKHGDSKPVSKKGLEALDVGDD